MRLQLRVCGSFLSTFSKHIDLIWLKLIIVKLIYSQTNIQMRMRAIKLATEWAKENEALSNPFRALVLAIIVSKNSASWNDIKTTLEKLWGDFNPNTLVFHLNRLAEAGLVEKVTMGDRQVYKPTQSGIKRTKTEANELLEELGEKLG